jgi:hypothetical protein
VAQGVEHLPSKLQALSSNPSTEGGKSLEANSLNATSDYLGGEEE